MIVTEAKIECSKIHDWDSLHDEFERVFGFPRFYGRNMDAWIDCMTSLDDPADGLSAIHVEPGKAMAIELDGAASLKEKHSELYEAIVECAAFVNWRRREQGEAAIICLSYSV